MPNTTEYLDRAREKANLAYDRHCEQWELIQDKPAPTLEDLDAWLSARASLHKAEDEFESIIRQMHPR
ncbi:hypothetical protein M2399_003450 [Pseudomonas sp. BIGb0450]|jgi:hypothetical protein|uniref:hypothetical protein n=1 Tax=unclassified Pseudomonas TaxID=196821 RepID=UPI0021670BB3|nr:MULTISPECIES: hypothetical protein [unclassified Pseudomonas]MCS3418400.1 hypothetical protein [Pseudomonas sp. BIGb0558]MCS3437999.1 hypothetical protein [Pseudomonas sp. BIGb0450]